MPKPFPCPQPCNVLLIGGGGREHALAWKLRQSPRLGELWVTDAQNAGLTELGNLCPVPMDMTNTFRMRRWCEQEQIHLVVVGPEGPLAAGISDVLADPARLVFGPTKAAAQIEANKVFAKNLMRQASVPTGDARIFKDAETARQYVEAREEPIVVKASGLAAGKGVFVCETQAEAFDAINRILVHREFGDAGAHIIVEEKFTGPEVSVLALVDGRTIWVLDPCQDHKRIGEGDTGPNTGGMGAYCPTPVVDEETLSLIEREVLVPTIDALRRDGIEYRGVLYAGIMLTPAGPKVLEFNCRFGDPECQPLMMRLKSDLLELLWATAAGQLEDVDIDFDERVACCVVMAAAGYPGKVTKGAVITGLGRAEEIAREQGGELQIFHAGTSRNADGEIVVNGGRVLGVTALAHDLQAARELANAACEAIHFKSAQWRRDIGEKALTAAAAGA